MCKEPVNQLIFVLHNQLPAAWNFLLSNIYSARLCVTKCTRANSQLVQWCINWKLCNQSDLRCQYSKATLHSLSLHVSNFVGPSWTLLLNSSQNNHKFSIFSYIEEDLFMQTLLGRRQKIVFRKKLLAFRTQNVIFRQKNRLFWAKSRLFQTRFMIFTTCTPLALFGTISRKRLFFYAFPKSHLLHRAVCMVAFLQYTHGIHWKWGNYRGLDCQYTFRGAICKGPQCLSIWLGGNACLQVHIAFINIILSYLCWVFTNTLINHSALKLDLISAVVLWHPNAGDPATCLVSNWGSHLRFAFRVHNIVE